MNLTTKELSKRWSLSEGTLSNWRSLKKGPKYTKIGRRVVYRIKDIEKFEAKNLVNVI
jgi:hypothetical protein